MKSLDTNVLIHYFLWDLDADKSRRSVDLVRRAALGGEIHHIPVTVFAELTFYLTRSRGIDRQTVAGNLMDFMKSPGLNFDFRDDVLRALEFWNSTGGLSFIDCLHLVRTSSLGMDAIYTFDKKMDRFPGVERLEP